MSDETLNQEGNTGEQEDSQVNANSNQSKEDYLLEQKRSANAEAKEWRVKFESLQQEVDGIEKAKNEAELDAIEKLKVRDQELADLKAGVEQDKLKGQWIDEVRKRGFSEKIAKLGIPKDLSADNLLDSVKQFDKDYKEFKVDPDDREPKPNTPFSSVQPKNNDLRRGKESMQDLIRKATGEE